MVVVLRFWDEGAHVANTGHEERDRLNGEVEEVTSPAVDEVVVRATEEVDSRKQLQQVQPVDIIINDIMRIRPRSTCKRSWF